MGERSGAGGGGGDKQPQQRGTVFGVDGVSKTGSTAQDAAIGFTAGEGTGKAGSNFEALSGATREQTDKAVAAAQAAQAAGTSPQRAAAEAIGAPAPINPIARAIGLDSEFARPTTAADEAAFDAFFADEVTGAPIPESRITLRSPSQMFMDNMQFGIDSLADIKAKHDADAALFGMTPSTSAVDRAIKDGKKVGIAAAPMATAQAVLGQTPDELSVEPFGGIGSRLPDELTTPPMSSAPAAPAPQGEYYGEDVNDPDLFGVPGGAYGREGELYGFPNVQALGEFQTKAMRGPKAISQALNFSLLNRGIQALTGVDAAASNLEAGRQNMRNMFDLGGGYNPETGRLEAKLPRGQIQMNQFGNVTYSGMPDPSYTGPFANLVNPPEEERGRGETLTETVVEEAVNPCPDGYALVDGVCQPTAEVVDTRFTLPAATPMSFQPMTQATPVQQINPFVLSPTGAALGRQI